MTTMRFFLCGSWTEGMVHFSKIQSYVQELKSAHISAKAVRTQLGFPLLLKEGANKIWGQVVDVQMPDVLLALLDEFHGFNPSQPEKGLQTREEVEILTEDGPCKAWAYFVNPKKLPANCAEIENGDWKQSLDQAPSMMEALTEKQKEYVLKLGAVSGRDIVPINDLSLYRELMKLELIVDKGRRLALSKLGREVYQHLV